jgi:16S rRNA (adenine1518-N6/adenine1519-N6)-dimethyltransferase
MKIQHTAKKSLGQNFLNADGKIQNMLDAGQVSASDTVYEIGPGKGVLTKKLLETGAKVIAIEKDNELYAYLLDIFADYISSGKLVLVHGDVLEIMKTHPFPVSYKLIANIPYNITGKIISDFLSLENKPSVMVLMIQLEVARRIVARDLKHSILSLAVQAYGTPKLVSKVSAGSFVPRPKVDSAILAVDNISLGFFKKHNIDEESFFKVIKSGFAHKRKKLLRNLEELDSEKNIAPALEKIFGELRLDTNARAEDIDLEMWGQITYLYSKES